MHYTNPIPETILAKRVLDRAETVDMNNENINKENIMTTTLLDTKEQKFNAIQTMTQSIYHLMINLASRWMDEAEYENIDDYQVVIAKELPAYVVITKMTKRPFGFRFMLSGSIEEYHFYVTTRSIGWKRIK